jgi:hypothetical protein
MATSSPPTHNAACCKLPPVVSDYTAQGQIISLPNLSMDLYVTGPKDASRYIIFNYDIFGFHPCTKQTADLLSIGLGARVVMPGTIRMDRKFVATADPTEDLFHANPFVITSYNTFISRIFNPYLSTIKQTYFSENHIYWLISPRRTLPRWVNGFMRMDHGIKCSH